jgi:hypothetical protein
MCLSYAGLPLYLLHSPLLILNANWALLQIPECYSLIVRCITCSILNYFYGLTSSLSEKTLLPFYHMFVAHLFLQPLFLPHRGFNVILHVWCSTVLWPKRVPYREHSSNYNCWGHISGFQWCDCHYICIVAVLNPPVCCEVAKGAIVGGLVVTQLEICFFRNFWAFDTQQSIAAVINRSHMTVEINSWHFTAPINLKGVDSFLNILWKLVQFLKKTEFLAITKFRVTSEVPVSLNHHSVCQYWFVMRSSEPKVQKSQVLFGFYSEAVSWESELFHV